MKKIVGFCIFITLLSCSEGRFDVPGKPTHPISINRFDQTFFKTGNSPDSAFLDLYANQIMEVGEPGSPMFREFDSIFRHDGQMRKIYSDCQNVFNDISPIEGKLTWAFYRLHYFFPDIPYPKVYMHLSGFGQSIVSAPNILSAGIDKYLGPDYPIYQTLYYPFQIQRMYPNKIVSDYITGWIRSEFTEESLMDQQRLLDYMIYEGKILFFVKVLLPDETMENITGFNKEQLNWCTTNEKKMWDAILKLKHLYSTDQLVISKYIGECSSTSFFPDSSPGRAIIWTGYKIVEAYMNKEQDVTIQKLLKAKTQDILAKSLYHP
ncbi:MAG: DUF2268 domain-containing putative Zn-dependent protease [Bacteroidales bacterium]|nr:DUF2268 domain-containing putative Zn-dependent protease [Bacteroidales bacterium]